jgi:hypothetical protein
MGTPMASGQAGGVHIANSNSCCPIFMNLGENLYGCNILSKFDNQLNRFSHIQKMANLPCPFSIFSNCCFPIIMKLGGNVYGHNISAKFDNHPNLFGPLFIKNS